MIRSYTPPKKNKPPVARKKQFITGYKKKPHFKRKPYKPPKVKTPPPPPRPREERFYSFSDLDKVVNEFKDFRAKKQKEEKGFHISERFYIRIWTSGFFEIVRRNVLKKAIYIAPIDDIDYIKQKIKQDNFTQINIKEIQKGGEDEKQEHKTKQDGVKDEQKKQEEG